LKFFNGVVGFLTNGRLVKVFMKTGDTELTMSDDKSWEDPDLMQAITGLAFLSVDWPAWRAAPNSVTHAQLANSFCLDRESAW
jgi:hypothetical protein